MDSYRIRVDEKTLTQLKELKSINNKDSYSNVIDSLIDYYMTNENIETNNEKTIEEKIDKILKTSNDNNKMLSILEEFSNSASKDLVITNNTSSQTQPTDWYKEASEEVENKIQIRRTRHLSN